MKSCHGYSFSRCLEFRVIDTKGMENQAFFGDRLLLNIKWITGLLTEPLLNAIRKTWEKRVTVHDELPANMPQGVRGREGVGEHHFARYL